MSDDQNKPKEELDELGKEMEEALKNIGQDIPTEAASAPNVAAAAGAPAPQPEPNVIASPKSGGGGFSSNVPKNQEELNFILDIPFDVTVEVGKSEMVVKEIINLGQGSVIELDRLTGDYLDVIINGKVIGQGEVVVVNDKFGIRLKKVITPMERIEQLR